MFTIIIPAVILSAILAYFGYCDDETIGIAFLCGLLGLMTGAFLGFLISLLIAIPAGPPKIERQEIIALNDNLTVSGSFFLGCGHIEEDMYYFYMVQDSDGGCRMQKIKVNDTVYVYEDNSGVPYIEKTWRTSRLRPWFTFDWYADYPQRVEIHIPRGSIIQRYTVDLE